MTEKNGILAASLLLLCVVSQGISVAYAQPNLPGAADSSRIEKRVLNNDLITPPQIIPPTQQGKLNEIPFATDGFILNQINLLGNNTYTHEHFRKLIEEYLGHNVDLDTLKHLTARITEIYREDGYFLSRVIVPEQEVKNGVVTIQIIEGYVGNVIVEDPDGIIGDDPMSLFHKIKNKITDLRPLHGPALENYLLLLNEGQGFSTTSYIKRSDDIRTTGAVDLVLVVSRSPQRFSLEYNNFGSRYVGPHQIQGTYVTGNVFSPFDQLSIQSAVSMPMDEMGFGALGYSFPLNDQGLRAQLNASYSSANPGYTLAPLEVDGTTKSYEAGITYPYLKSRRNNIDFGAKFKLQNSSTEFLDQELIDDKTRSIELSVDYEGLDQLNGVNRVIASLEKGFDVLGATETGSDKLSRAQGRSDFAKSEIWMSRRQPMSKGFVLDMFFKAQYTPQALLSSQEFGFGGNDFGRAYDSSEILGDKGVAGSLVLNYNDLDTDHYLGFKLVPFVFYDIGKIWNNDSGSESLSAASTGFGTYYYFNENISGSLQFAWPLTKSIDTPIINDDNGPRVLFNMAVHF